MTNEELLTQATEAMDAANTPGTEMDEVMIHLLRSVAATNLVIAKNSLPLDVTIDDTPMKQTKEYEVIIG